MAPSNATGKSPKASDIILGKISWPEKDSNIPIGGDGWYVQNIGTYWITTGKMEQPYDSRKMYKLSREISFTGEKNSHHITIEFYPDKSKWSAEFPVPKDDGITYSHADGDTYEQLKDVITEKTGYAYASAEIGTFIYYVFQ